MNLKSYLVLSKILLTVNGQLNERNNGRYVYNYRIASQADSRSLNKKLTFSNEMPSDGMRDYSESRIAQPSRFQQNGQRKIQDDNQKILGESRTYMGAAIPVRQRYPPRRKIEPKFIQQKQVEQPEDIIKPDLPKEEISQEKTMTPNNIMFTYETTQTVNREPTSTIRPVQTLSKTTTRTIKELYEDRKAEAKINVKIKVDQNVVVMNSQMCCRAGSGGNVMSCNPCSNSKYIGRKGKRSCICRKDSIIFPKITNDSSDDTNSSHISTIIKDFFVSYLELEKSLNTTESKYNDSREIYQDYGICTRKINSSEIICPQPYPEVVPVRNE